MIRNVRFLSFILLFLIFFQTSQAQKSHTEGRNVWTIKQASDWYEKQGWLVGSNYTPAYAINQLEFWQPATFDTARISRELGWAESIGMNTMRVFLHDLLYEQDPLGFLQRLDVFLRIASRHHIRPLLVLFDSVWDPFPRLGKQKDPTPGVHNSGWVQSPGANALEDSSQYPRLKKYVQAVIGKLSKDNRVLGWDVWNEPDNTNGGQYHKEEPANKVTIVDTLLVHVFQWARAVDPVQPLTAGVWVGDEWGSYEKLNPTAKIIMSNSDIISFHNYDNAEEFEKRIVSLLNYNRPMICTEYMARPRNSTFQNTLPLAKKYHVGVYNWGFVQGKSQTNYPWDSWDKPYASEPALWFHDVFRTDGTPYKQEEVDLIKKLTGKNNKNQNL
jgi:hypothetical protein